MSVSCTICKNRTNSQHYVHLYADSYQEIHKNNLLKHKNEFSFVHIICSSFFPETELIVQNTAINPISNETEENKTIAETIVCNYKEVSSQSTENCKICSESRESEVLIPCLSKECEMRFHLSCIMERNEIEKVKLINPNNSNFKYGLLCTDHATGKQNGEKVIIKANPYEIFKMLDAASLRDELTRYEGMFANINEIIKGDDTLHKLLELSRTEATKTQEALAKKKRRRRSTATNIKLSQAQTENGEEASADPTQTPNKEQNGINTEASDSLVTPKKPKSRKKEENKDGENKEKTGGENENKEKPKKRNRGVKLTSRSKNVIKLTQNANGTSLEITALNESRESSKNFSEISDTIALLRKKKTNDSSNYNLRDEIKAATKLKFDTGNWIQELALPKKPKDKTKTVTESNRLLTTEEKKKLFWNDLNENYFRKPYTDEAENLLASEGGNMSALIESEAIEQELSPVPEDTKAAFNPNFELNELMAFTKPTLISSTFNPADSLKVLFEFNSNPGSNKPATNFLGYFRMKKKAQNEMPLPENPETIDTNLNPKYTSCSSFDTQELKNKMLNNLKPISFQSKYKFHDQNIDSENLSAEGYDKLFGLKHIEPLGPEEVIEVKSKVMLERDIEALEKEKEKEFDLDDLSKEIVYFEYLLKNVTVPENNVRKEKLAYKMKGDHAFLKTPKLLEKARKFESEFKLGMIKKLFYCGFKDKLNCHVTRGFIKSSEEKIVSELRFVPKADRNGEKDSKVIKLSREVQSVEVVETDCCVCFSNQFSEWNPIVYCDNCNASFHKYCYGLTEVPSENFYCDICLSVGDPATRSRAKGSSNSRARKGSVKIVGKLPTNEKDLRCQLCNIEDFPLKRFKRTEWFHITCLFLHNMIQFKNGEWILKLEKIPILDQLKIELSPHECSVCKSRNGIISKCIDKDCDKRFHVLCAYLQGYAVDLAEYEDTKEDKTKTGLNPLVYCPEHSKDQNRDVMQQQYFRRYTTNFKNTLSYETLEDYIKHLAEEEDLSLNATKIETELSNDNKTINLPENINIAEHVEQIEQIEVKVVKREAEVSTEDLENTFLDDSATKKIKLE